MVAKAYQCKAETLPGPGSRCQGIVRTLASASPRTCNDGDGRPRDPRWFRGGVAPSDSAGQLNGVSVERDLRPERMDDPALNRSEHLAALEGLARINRWTCVSGPIYRRLRHYATALGRPLRVLDVATGSGDLPIDWAQRARRDGIGMEIEAVDISEVALESARQRADEAKLNVRFCQRDVLHGRLPEGADVVTCNLFLHHLAEQDIARLLISMQAVARHAVVICDLERSRANLAAVWFASRLLTRSPIVHEDAVLSVRGALTRAEFSRLAADVLDRPILVRGLPPCRFLAIVEGVTQPAAEPLWAQATQPA